jgi:dihydrofolate reductase
MRNPTHEGGLSMRKVVASELVSLDGVMEKPEQWAFSYSNDEMAKANASGMANSDAMLLGRVTYEEFAAFWPFQDRTEQPYTDHLNNTPKYVVSRTLDEPLEWQNSLLVKGDVAEEVSRLKEQPGKDIGIVGSGALVRWLLRENLLDELSLMVHPIVLGRGERLFEEGGDQKALELVDSKTFSTGVVHLTYQLVRS